MFLSDDHNFCRKLQILNFYLPYFSELAKTWSETENLTVRLSQIESRMLMIDGILDVEEVKLNGSSENIILEYDEIPIRGDVNI